MSETPRLEFPIRRAKLFLQIFFAILAMPVLYWLFRCWFLYNNSDGDRDIALILYGIFLAMIAAGYWLGMFLLGRRPTAMEARESGLVLFCGRREAAVPWTEVAGLTQVIIRGMATHVVRFRDGRSVPFGLGEKPQGFARQIAQRAGLTWITDPFIAERRGP